MVLQTLERAALPALLVTHLVVHGWLDAGETVFSRDLARDMAASRLLLGGDGYGSLLGPDISNTQLHLGPFVYGLYAAVLAVFCDVRTITCLSLAAGAVALGALYMLLRRRVHWAVALSACAALALTPYWHEVCHMIWHPSLAPPFAALTLWALDRFDREPTARTAALAFASLASAVQVHAALAAWAPVLLWTLPRLARARGLKALAAPLLAGLVTLLPALVTLGLDLARTGGVGVLYQSERPVGPGLDVVLRVVGGLGFGRQTAEASLMAGAVVCLLAMVGTRHSAHRGLVRLVLAALGLGLIGGLLAPAERWSPRYLHGAALPAFVLAALGLDLIVRRLRHAELAAVGLAMTLLVAPWARPSSDTPLVGQFCTEGTLRRLMVALIEGHGVDDGAYQSRVHGLTCRTHHSGARAYFLGRPPQPTHDAPVEHLAVFESAQVAHVSAQGPVTLESIAVGAGVSFVLARYVPVIDYERTTRVGGSSSEADDEHSIVLRVGLRAPTRELRVEVLTEASTPCAVRATWGAQSVLGEPLGAGSTPGLNRFRLTLDATATDAVQVHAGPCRGLRQVEVL